MIWIVLMLAVLIIIPYAVALWFKAHAAANRRDAERSHKVREFVDKINSRKED